MGVYLRIYQQRGLVKTEDIKYCLAIQLVSGRASDEGAAVVTPRNRACSSSQWLEVTRGMDGVLSRFVVEGCSPPWLIDHFLNQKSDMQITEGVRKAT